MLAWNSIFLKKFISYIYLFERQRQAILNSVIQSPNTCDIWDRARLMLADGGSVCFSGVSDVTALFEPLPLSPMICFDRKVESGVEPGL